MSKIIKQTPGYLSSIERKTDVHKYDSHLNKPGLIIVGESINKHPGKKFVCFFYNSDSMITCFHTSCGNIEEKDNKLNFSSVNSKYEFTIDETCIDKDTKAEILLNVIW